MKGENLLQFTEALHSAAPVPGGGGASAVTGALGAALAGMVGNLTTGKKKYAAYEADIQEILKKAGKLWRELLDLAEKDAAAFEPLARAYGMPRNTPEESEERERVLQACLRGAVQAPLDMVRRIMEAVALHEELVVKGSAMMISDVGTGAALLRGALEGAAMNILVNTRLMSDRAYADELNMWTDQTVAEGIRRTEAIYRAVIEKLRS